MVAREFSVVALVQVALHIASVLLSLAALGTLVWNAMRVSNAIRLVLAFIAVSQGPFPQPPSKIKET